MLTFFEAIGRLATFVAAMFTMIFGAFESGNYGVALGPEHGFYRLNAFTLNRLGLGLLRVLVAVVVSGVVFGLVAEIFDIQSTLRMTTKPPVPAASVPSPAKLSDLWPGQSKPYIA